jgi:hypothetical protein
VLRHAERILVLVQGGRRNARPETVGETEEGSMPDEEPYWTKLKPKQLGWHAEHLVKLKFMLAGFDVYEPALDVKGVDFVVRGADGCRHYDVQVKSARGSNYVFIQKDKLGANLLVAVVHFQRGQGDADVYLLSSEECTSKSEDIFRSRDYPGKQSKPEWGLDWTKKTVARLEGFRFERKIDTLKHGREADRSR